MSDEKDPVPDQIEIDAIEYTEYQYGVKEKLTCSRSIENWECGYTDYTAGHGDGWNRCLDEVMDIALIKRTSFNDDTAMELFIKELEKMRR